MKTMFLSDHVYVGWGDGAALGLCGAGRTSLLIEDDEWNLAKATWGPRAFSILGVFPGMGLYGRGTRVAPGGEVSWTQVWLGSGGEAVAEAMFAPGAGLAPGGARTVAGPHDSLPTVHLRGDLVAASAPFRAGFGSGAALLAWSRVNGVHAAMLSERVVVPEAGCHASRVESVRAGDGSGVTPGGPDDAEIVCRRAVRMSTMEASLAPVGQSLLNFPSPDDDPVAGGWPNAGHWTYLACDAVAAMPADQPGVTVLLDTCARPLPGGACDLSKPCGECPCEYQDCLEACAGSDFCPYLCDDQFGTCNAKCENGCMNGLDPSCDPPCTCNVCPDKPDCEPPPSCFNCSPADVCADDPEAPYCSWYEADIPGDP